LRLLLFLAAAAAPAPLLLHHWLMTQHQQLAKVAAKQHPNAINCSRQPSQVLNEDTTETTQRAVHEKHPQ
jgi:hypothetical protein